MVIVNYLPEGKSQNVYQKMCLKICQGKKQTQKNNCQNKLPECMEEKLEECRCETDIWCWNGYIEFARASVRVFVGTYWYVRCIAGKHGDDKPKKRQNACQHKKTCQNGQNFTGDYEMESHVKISPKTAGSGRFNIRVRFHTWFMEMPFWTIFW